MDLELLSLPRAILKGYQNAGMDAETCCEVTSILEMGSSLVRMEHGRTDHLCTRFLLVCPTVIIELENKR